MADFHIIPSIEQLRQRPSVAVLESTYGRAAVVSALRAEAEHLRSSMASERTGADAPTSSESAAHVIEQRLGERLASMLAPSLTTVLNATGVVIHTNLGRAPLSRAAIDRMAAIGAGYSNLEYDLVAGRRGRRDAHAERLLCLLTGAEAAVVVNNNAAATLILLAALAAGREVVISRGELVEIGGGFRVPDVLAQSGAVLREVGTTNKTRAADYSAAISERTAMLLRVHPSNFTIEGFTERPTLEHLVAIGQRLGVIVAEDLGSGCLLPLAAREPLVQDSVAAGADVVCFSGDKMLGGPQAGILVGRRDPIDRIRRHPLMRALRVDKVTYAALEATLIDYAANRADVSVPVPRMLAMTRDEIDRRARAVLDRLPGGATTDTEIIDGASAVGGGSAPGLSLPTRLIAIAIEGTSANALEARLRRGAPPVIARVEHDRVLLDLRTVAPEDDERLARCLAQAIASHSPAHPMSATSNEAP